MRGLVAFTITFIIYILFIYLYFFQLRSIKIEKKQFQKEHIIKIDVREFLAPKKMNPSEALNRVKQEEKKKNILKEKINKKIINKPIIKKKRIKSKLKKEKKIEKIEQKNDVIIPESEMIFIENPLIQTSSNVMISEIYPNKKIKKLYGKSFNSFSKNQKKFIVDNLDDIHRITQRTLSYRGYPSGALAAETGQEGTNIVSFNLHPNGDISNLRLVQKVGYRILDENTLETIRTAYKDYPYPEEITKIVFYVEYSIFSY